MIAYRDAGPADAAVLADLGRRTFVETFGHLYKPEDLAVFLVNHSEETWRGELADPAFSVRLAEEERVAAAYAKIGPPTLPFEPRGPSTELRQFYVLKPWHGTGIADELMHWSIEEAKRRGAEDLYLSVFVDNHRARRFYERYGFTFVGTYAFIVGNHEDEDHVMRLSLRETQMTVEVLRAGVLEGVPHGFLGRLGGVSEGVCSGLNVGFGSGDDPEAIAENRRRAIEAVLPGGKLATLHQVHSPTALYVTEPFPEEARPHADALVTDRPGLLIGIFTADCAPVLFADREAGVVAAAHAGWKGAFSGVVEAAVSEMERRGAARDRIAAAVGPCIARRSYEVDEAFFRRFAEAQPENERFFSLGRDGYHQFDLEGFVVSRLAESGLARIEALGEDTYSQQERFFSYRRGTHRGEGTYGRQISLIGLS